ncbi:unnamed protein product [Phyllotreta striolata]|uniref:Uncharacterized protein n=1 Tax=Phyllotreta striolata TaxID=444603 RepID=A0A9N9TMF2_PHYSR|nr:unnamed protein product [Phyllotreta striolata]
MSDRAAPVILSDEIEEHLIESFDRTAALQGRWAYLLMSLYIMNAESLSSSLGFDLYPYLWFNMLYGFAVLLVNRPTFTPVKIIPRVTVSILGSLMFNHATMNCFKWLSSYSLGGPYARAFCGFICGRIMMVHFQALLYHLDTRTTIPGVLVLRDIAFEQMYMRSHFRQ